MKEQITMIQQVLAEAGIEIWNLREDTVSSAELFFIRRRLDMRRMKETVKYPVTVYRPFQKDGKDMLGFSEVTLLPTQSRDEMLAALKDTYFAASFVANPAFPLPEKTVSPEVVLESDLNRLPVEQAAMDMAEALFAADHNGASFINSAEFFATRTTRRILTSWGTDVGYTKCGVRGEFVVQCKEPEDVETYHSFAYDSLDKASLTALAETALSQVSDRAAAQKSLASGRYDLILSGDNLAKVLDYYVSRTQVGMVYPGYSTWKVGSNVQEHMDGGERLNMTLHATVPFSVDGIPMSDRKLLEDGKVCVVHGGVRLSAYLGVPPTGEYAAFCCENGTKPFAALKEKPYLYPVCFSDFQMDAMTGHFGGEIRLAYYFDGSKMHIVTGGSVNGSIADCAGQLVFSRERYDSESYHGPLAVRIPGVKVAGTV